MQFKRKKIKFILKVYFKSLLKFNNTTKKKGKKKVILTNQKKRVKKRKNQPIKKVKKEKIIQ